MRHTVVSSLLVIAGALPIWSAEPPPTLPAATPWAELTIPDGARLLAHWATGPIGRAWAEAGVTPLRTRVVREVPELTGMDLFAVMADSSHLRLVLNSIDGPADDAHVHYQAQVELGSNAELAFAALAQRGTVVPLAGADEAVLLGDGDTAVRLVRRGHWLLLGPAADPAPQPLAANDEHDISGSVAGPLFADWVLASHPITADGPTEAQIRSVMPQITGELDLGPTGGVSQLTINSPAPWLVPITPASLKRLNGQVLDLSVIGLDGQALWREAEPLVQRLTAHGAPDPLAALGITSTWQQLVNGLSGTWAIVITPAMPIPGYSVIGPRSPALDELIGLLAKKYDSDLPADGACITLMPNGMPISLTFARTADQWLASSDPLFAANWVETADGGWQDSMLGKLATAKLDGDGCALLIGDTQAQVRALAPLVGMFIGAMPQVHVLPAEKQSMMTFMSRLATNVTPGWNVVHHRGRALVATGEGMFASGGSVPVVAVLAGMLLPAISMTRESAKRANSGNNMRQLVLGSVVWCNDNDQNWPPTVEKMRQDMGGDIPDKVLRSPGDPTNEHAYLYIRPASNSVSIQPAFVEDPACWKGKGCMVAFCDGHVAWIPKDRARRVWDEANILAVMPKAAVLDQGVAPEDWAAVQDDLTPGQRPAKQQAP